MSFKIGLIAVLFLLAGTLSAHAQDFEVSGTVLSVDDGMPLPGVNVVEQGTQRGTSTDADGEFTLAVSGPNAALVFSFVGYQQQVVEVDGRSELTVRLQPGTELLDEVVVTALGVERERRSVGYSISEVDSEDLVDATETNMANLLQGKVAGVIVSPTAGGPGSSTRITIRGASSLAGNNQPLYVVDGVPIDNSNTSSATQWGGFDGGDGIQSVNPENVESISVLKGAAAAALYGTRARDGVVMITTKTGRSTSGFGAQFSSTTSFEEALTDFSDYQTEYGQGTRGRKPSNQQEALETGLSSWGAELDGSQVVQFDGVERPYENVGNQLDQFYDTGVSTKNTVALDGGFENGSIRFVGTHLNTESIVPTSGLERVSLTMRGTAQYGRLTTDVKANYINELTNDRTRLSDAPGNPNFSIMNLPNNVDPDVMKPGIDEEGAEVPFTESIFITNPYWATNKFNIDDERDRILGAVNARYQIMDWLSAHGRTGVDWYTLRRTSITPWGTRYRPGGDMSESEWRVLETNTDLNFNATRQLPYSMAVSAVLGGHFRHKQSEQIGSFGSQFKIPGLQTISNTQNLSPIYDFSEKEVHSFYGSFDVSYNDYLFLAVTGRNDWSSTLPENENSFFYPSASLGFVFSDALNEAIPSWMSFGKVRAAWAKVGSDTDPYMLNLTYSILDASHQDQPLGVVAQNSVPLANLKPTSTVEKEVGFDVRFFDNRLGLDFAWYTRSTTDQILSTTVSEASGFTQRVINAGELKNQGFEFLLTGVPLRNENTRWGIDLNFSKNNSTVEALAGDQEVLELGVSRTFTAWVTAEVGQEYGTIWGYEYERDNNGNIVHGEDGLPVRASERAILGHGTPDWTAGVSNRFTYKNFSVNALVDVKWGGQLFSATNANAYGTGLHKNTLEGRSACDEAAGADGYPEGGCMVGDGVIVTERDPETGEILETRPNDVEVLPEAYYGEISGQIAEEFVYDANFVKLRQLRVSYRLPDQWVTRAPLRSATVSVVGRNLFYFHNSVPNVDPESSYNNGNAQGLELAGVPNIRSLGINVNLQF